MTRPQDSIQVVFDVLPDAQEMVVPCRDYREDH